MGTIHSASFGSGSMTSPPPEPPFPIDANGLFIAYFASAGLACFLSLGWTLPIRVLDLYVEFKRHLRAGGRAGQAETSTRAVLVRVGEH